MFTDWYDLNSNQPEEIKMKGSFPLKYRQYLCLPETKEEYYRRFQAPEIVSLIYRAWFQSFPSQVALEDNSSGIIKYVNHTIVYFSCTVIQNSLSNGKNNVILLSCVKKLHFILACEGKFFPSVVRGSWLFSKSCLSFNPTDRWWVPSRW